jgi:hypothetical protein
MTDADRIRCLRLALLLVGLIFVVGVEASSDRCPRRKDAPAAVIS